MADLKQTLNRLHEAIAEDLLTKVEGGQATPAEINAAITFLKNNGVSLDVEKQKDHPAARLKAVLPFEETA
jgi:hypothetical protein